MQIAQNFFPLLRGFDVGDLDNHPGTVYATCSDLRLGFTNKAWGEFARENGAKQFDRWSLGSSILEAIPEALLPFYQPNFEKVLAEARPWEHLYECSSPELRRFYHMLVYPLLEAKGLLFIHSLHRGESYPPNDRSDALEMYTDPNGLIVQCCHCRRVRRVADSACWDWVPQLVSSPAANVSHGLCKPCEDFYYAEEFNNDPFPRVITTIDLPTEGEGNER